MTTLAVTSVSSLLCQVSTCFRIGSKFRCMRSTPTEMQSMSENDFECFPSTGVKSPGTMFPNPGNDKPMPLCTPPPLRNAMDRSTDRLFPGQLIRRDTFERELAVQRSNARVALIDQVHFIVVAQDACDCFRIGLS